MDADQREASRIGTRGLAGGSKKKTSSSSKQHDGEVHKMELTRGKNGGYVAHHHHKHPESGTLMRDEEPHVLADAAAMHDHIDQHMPEQGAAEPGAGGAGAQEEDPEQ